MVSVVIAVKYPEEVTDPKNAAKKARNPVQAYIAETTEPGVVNSNPPVPFIWDYLVSVDPERYKIQLQAVALAFDFLFAFRRDNPKLVNSLSPMHREQLHAAIDALRNSRDEKVFCHHWNREKTQTL